MWHRTWWWLGAVIAVTLLGDLAAPTARPAAGQDLVYSARGPYAVGVRDYVIADAARPLPASVWYPAQGSPPQRPSITYRAPGITIAGQALRDAAPAPTDGPYPLVIFSHGAGGFRFQSTYFTEHLASHGFVVIAAEHPGSTIEDPIGADFRDGEDVRAQPDEPAALLDDLARNYALRPLDVLREIAFAESLTASGGDLDGLIDTDRIAVSGHSFGGYTALAAGGARLDFSDLASWCVDPQGVRFEPGSDPPFRTEAVTAEMALVNCLIGTRQGLIAAARGLDDVPHGLWPPTTDLRIRAVVALAPWNAAVFGPEGLAALDIPTMIQVGTADETTPPATDAYVYYTGISSAEKVLVAFEDAEHLLFVNAGMEVDDPVWDMDAAHALVTHFATAFLRATLYGDAAAGAALAPENVAYQDVLYHRAP